MTPEESYNLTDRWKDFYQDLDLYRSVYEALEIWFTLVNQDANQDIVNLMIKLDAIDYQVRKEYNKLSQVDRLKADALEIGPFCLPAIETIINVCLSVSDSTNIYGTTRKEITDKLNELGLPSKPVEVDLLQRSWVKLKDQLQKPQKIDIIAHVDVLFSECKGSHNVRGEAMEEKLTSDEYEAYKQAKQANGGKPITQTIKKHFAERSKGEAKKSK